MARVRTWSDNHARFEQLYADEARAAKTGLWADKAFAVQSAEKITGEVTGFLIVEGVVKSVAAQDTRTFLNFGEDYRTDFTIMVPAEDYSNWTAKDPALASLEGKRVRVRGYVSDRGGPLIVADHPAAIEVLK